MSPAQARIDGQMARLRNQPFQQNPFPLNTANSREWSRGWRDTDERLK